MIKYKILNSLDEQERLMEQPTFYEATSGSQYNTHKISYLKSRQLLQDLGQVMGLEKLIAQGRGR